MYDTPKHEELSPNESYAWGIIRALTDLAFAHAKASKKNAIRPTRWLYMAHPKVANVGREYNLLMHHLSQYAPYDDDGASYIAMITDVMQIAGFGLDFGEMTEAPGDMFVLAEAVIQTKVKTPDDLEPILSALKDRFAATERPPEMISLPGYAELHEVDASTIRKMAQSGKLKTAKKIGGRWLVDKGEPYPEDGRRKQTE